MEKKRSRGVIILGVCLLICVIPGLAAAFIGAISGSVPGSILLDIAMRIPVILSPIIFLLTGIGVLMLKNWARLLVLFLSPILSYVAIGFGSILVEVFLPTSKLSAKVISAIIIPGMIIMFLCILYYLTRPKVKEQFK